MNNDKRTQSKTNEVKMTKLYEKKGKMPNEVRKVNYNSKGKQERLKVRQKYRLPST